MTLKQYIKKHGITIKEMADRIGLAPYSVERYIAGRLPVPEVVVSIYKATKGEVQPNDFYGIKAK